MMRKTLLALALFFALSPLATAQDSAESRGEALLTRNCARCHAVGRTDISLHAEAPPFRTLSRRYPIEALEEALGEGLVSGHPDMPEFRFSAPDVGAIVAYLNSIQDR
jgi:mono/diheme cytochrome c family protein